MSVNPQQKKSFMDGFIIVVIAVSVIVVAAGLGMVFFSEELTEQGLFGEGDLVFVDFDNLSVEPGERHFLACPEYYCENAVPDEIVPVFPVHATELRNRLTTFVDSQTNVSLKQMDLADLDFIFLAYIGSQPFPDVVYVKLYDLGGKRSTAAIYSVTVKGEDGVGRNRQRVQNWLAVLGQP